MFQDKCAIQKGRTTSVVRTRHRIELYVFIIRTFAFTHSALHHLQQFALLGRPRVRHRCNFLTRTYHLRV